VVEVICRSCGNTFAQFNKLQRKCGKCAYNLNAKPKKPIKRMGKVGKQWVSDRNEWVGNHPPSHEGYWYCVIGGGALTIDTLTVDHDISRGRDQSKRSDQDNLQPMCGFHNGDKGSLSTAGYLLRKPDLKCS